MKATYTQYRDCISCIDMFGDEMMTHCKDCMNSAREEVEVLSLGVGLFGNKAIVKKSDGSVLNVPINSLRIGE